jgi:nitrite reductase/ring-hydroxylating ferredoxin subunit
MGKTPEERVDRVVGDLLKDRPLRLRPGDEAEKEAIVAAAQLAGARDAHQHMSPSFRRRLAAQLEGARATGWVTRRSALVAGIGLATGALAVTSLEKVFERNASPLPGSLVNVYGGKWSDVGALADFQEGVATRVNAGAVGAFVTRRGSNVSAVSSICSHLPCELHRQDPGGLLNCPCHNVDFSTDGQPIDQTYPLPSLAIVRVRVNEAGRVEVLGT